LAIVGYMDYVTIAEVAREYRVSGEHIRRMCVDGRLSAERVGEVWRIPRSSLRVFKSRKCADAAGGAAGPEDLVTKAR
jgi:excisionase family DNA binding protein